MGLKTSKFCWAPFGFEGGALSGALGFAREATGAGDTVVNRAAGATGSGTFNFSAAGAASGRLGPGVGRFASAVAGADARAVGET